MSDRVDSPAGLFSYNRIRKNRIKFAKNIPYEGWQLSDDLLLLSIYGSEDGVLNAGKLAEGRDLAPERYEECVIEGGNHAQFGDYGIQKGDGNASVSREYQQFRTADLILQNIDPQ